MRYFDGAKMSVSGTPGTGVITLGSAINGNLTFAQAGVADGDWPTCGFVDGANFQIARCSYASTGTALTVQQVLRSSGAGNTGQISLTSSAIVFISQAAEDMPQTGELRHTIATSAPNGWLLCNDGTIGDGSSGSSTRANIDCVDLFALIYNGLSDSNAPLLTSAGGATTRGAQGTAAAAWAAHCRVTLPRLLGRALGVAGAGSGLTSRALGSFLGEETHTLTSAEQASMNFSNATGTLLTVNIGAVDSSPPYPAGQNSTLGGAQATNAVTSISGTAVGGGGSHNNMQPTTFVNVLIKL